MIFDSYANGVLADGTRWSVELRKGEMHHSGLRSVMAILTQDRPNDEARRLWLVSGMVSMHRIRLAIETCSSWTEVPLAIEAIEWMT